MHRNLCSDYEGPVCILHGVHRLLFGPSVPGKAYKTVKAMNAQYALKCMLQFAKMLKPLVYIAQLASGSKVRVPSSQLFTNPRCPEQSLKRLEAVTNLRKHCSFDSKAVPESPKPYLRAQP